MKKDKPITQIKQIFRARIEGTFEKLRMLKCQAAMPENVVHLELWRVHNQKEIGDD